MGHFPFSLFPALPFYPFFLCYSFQNRFSLSFGNTLPVDGSEGENAFVAQEQKYSKATIFLLLLLLAFHGTVAVMDYMGNTVNEDGKIIAHRGLVSTGVENTIEALEGAKAAGADMVELNMPLLIEIKPHGKEPENFTELLLEKLKEYGVEKTNPLMSLDISLMEGIEETAPEWKTGVVIPVQFGDFATKLVDFYAIEDSSYNGYLMGEVQDMGKEFYVWTINEEDKILKYLQRPVDGIITDDPGEVLRLRKDMLEDRSYYGMYERMAG